MGSSRKNFSDSEIKSYTTFRPPEEKEEVQLAPQQDEVQEIGPVPERKEPIEVMYWEQTDKIKPGHVSLRIDRHYIVFGLQ